ncbi:hypothetical protein [Phytopseudomonas dryadis]|uniref:Sel1 repeat family protein n=1 Tax=Phytopseudomonas dryadis TaxID=2487520 RepID=A0A4Q9QWF1_9GAMM|nr:MULTISPECIES: hypothetical protein [Pseudomonas]TBU88331.1 hypothetical protein DNK44_18890 [Pseudomonas dryadis]TBV01786.1 hypothetical protein DNK34_20250 [Pseudomonas dryadis]TBV14406.1 hypothetical protein DNK41_20190 [Pseudomonas sp. FRB 230]
MSPKRLAYSLALVACIVDLQVKAADNAVDLIYNEGIEAHNQLRQLLADQSDDKDELNRYLNLFDSRMESAAERGHPAAVFLQAQRSFTKRNADPTTAQESRQKACSSLDGWAKKGFVAAAVLYQQECNTAFKRYRLNSPEHLAVVDMVEATLHQTDPAIAYYPLPFISDQCFATTHPPQMQRLTYEQFRTEAEFILGNARVPEDRESMQRNLDWLDKAFEHGCSATWDLREVLREQMTKSP